MRRFATLKVVLLALLLFSSVSAWQSPKSGETRIEVEKIPYEVKYVFDRDMGAGRIKKVQHGIDGEIRRTYSIEEKEGSVVEKTLIKEERIESTPAVFHMGKPNSRAVSRGSYTRAKVLTMDSTAYTPDAGLKNPTYRTSTGTKAEYGVIAVDPKVVPLGTLMYVEGYGFGIAEDTGGAIKGNIIDVCVQTRAEAMKWGRKKVKVHIFTGKVEVPTSEEASKSSSKGTD
jgi:3D (Asp-Asp-Asp) domain-containing protein